MMTGCDGKTVFKNRLCPVNVSGVMAEFAVRREFSRFVIRVNGFPVIIGVTAETLLRKNYA